MGDCMANEVDSNNDAEAYGKSIAALIDALGLPAGFFKSIYEERDWSFVIQLHALIEGTLNHAIEKKIGTELESIFRRMPMSGPTGRIAVATKLGLLEFSDATAYLKILGRMRNACAHGIRSAVDFTIEGWIEAKPHPEQIIMDLCGGRDAAAEVITLGGKAVERGTFARQNPKLVLYWLGGMLIGELYEAAEMAACEREKADILEKMWQLQRAHNELVARCATPVKPMGLFQLLGELSTPTDEPGKPAETAVQARPAHPARRRPEGDEADEH